MPGGGDECIRNSLVCKIVSMNSKYRGAVTCDVTPVSWVTLCFAECTRTGYFRGQWNQSRPQWPSNFGAWCEAWFEVRDENGSLEVCPGIPEGALLCHIKTTSDDPAQLPGATEEIVLAKGAGPAKSPSWGNKGSSAPGRALQPIRLPPRTAAARDHGPASNRGNEFIMPQSLHFHHAQISP